MDAEQDNNRKPVAMVVGGVVAVAAIVVAFLLLTDDGDEVDTSSTTTTGETTTTETTTPEETTTTVFAPTVDPSVPIFPDPGTSQRFDDPVAVATAWVTDVVGFRDPVVGAFQEGDSRSGEVEVRGFADGAPTVVLVRQLEDDTWFVIAATTDSIRVTDPEAGATITSPQPLVGAAYAFEGVVDVRLYADGDTEPIATSFVMGRGDGVLGDFSDTIEFTAPDGAAFGVLIFSEASGEDGSAVYATAFRVAL